MDLRLLFKPLETPNIKSGPAEKIHEALYLNVDELPDWKNAKIALFSISQGNEEFAKPIREEFYNLYSGYTTNSIVDLGILKAGVDFEETLSRVKEVCNELISKKVIPLILGDNHALDLGQYMGHEGKNTNLLVVDSRIDLLESDKKEEMHTKQIILHEPNYLFNYSHIGYQSYLNPPEIFELLEKLNFDKLRLGEISNDIKVTEPLVRFANMISFDLSAIKHDGLNAKQDSFPFGITPEQACQLSWYAGMSNNCSSFGIYSYDEVLDNRRQSAKVVATMLWYFIEAVSEREEASSFDSDYYKKFIVSGNEFKNINFYKSKIKEFWWIEVGDNIMPCSYSDYLTASEGIVPGIYDTYLMKYA